MRAHSTPSISDRGGVEIDELVRLAGSCGVNIASCYQPDLRLIKQKIVRSRPCLLKPTTRCEKRSPTSPEHSYHFKAFAGFGAQVGVGDPRCSRPREIRRTCSPVLGVGAKEGPARNCTKEQDHVIGQFSTGGADPLGAEGGCRSGPCRIEGSEQRIIRRIQVMGNIVSAARET